MIAVSDYLTQILAQIEPVGIENIPVQQALGATLASDITARYAVPPFTNSAMDGFAFRAKDLAPTNPQKPVVFPVSGDIPAGSTKPFVLPDQTACRIMTGAPLPQGADTVVMVENTNIPPGPVPLPAKIEIQKPPAPKANVRLQGEDAQVGDLVLHAGEYLTPAALSSAVSVGYDQIPVYRKPKVAVISTGDELRPAGEELGYGQIPDSNSILLTALLQQIGIPVTQAKCVGDNPENFQAALEYAAQDADLVVTSGGVSAGAYDVVKQVSQNSQIQFTKVAMQPGKPQGFGIYHARGGQSTYLATLPGNPVSVFVSFHVFVRPILAALQGQDPFAQVIHRAALTSQAWQSPAGKTQFMPVHLEPAKLPGESAIVTPTHRLGSRSHFVASLHLANGLAVIPPPVTEVTKWSVVEVILT